MEVLQTGVLRKKGAASWNPKASSRLFVLHADRLEYFVPPSTPRVLHAFPISECRVLDQGEGECDLVCGDVHLRLGAFDAAPIRSAIGRAVAVGETGNTVPDRVLSVRNLVLGAKSMLPSATAFIRANDPSWASLDRSSSAWIVATVEPAAIYVVQGAMPTLAQRGTIPLYGPAWTAGVTLAEGTLTVRTGTRAYELTSEAGRELELERWRDAIADAVRHVSADRPPVFGGDFPVPPVRTSSESHRSDESQEHAPGARDPASPKLGAGRPASDEASESHDLNGSAGAPAVGAAEGANRGGGEGGGAVAARTAVSSVSAAAMFMWCRLATERDRQDLRHAFSSWRRWVESEMLARVEEMLSHFVGMAVADSTTPDMLLKSSYVPLGAEFGDGGDESYAPFGSITPFEERLKQVLDADAAQAGQPTAADLTEEVPQTPTKDEGGSSARAANGSADRRVRQLVAEGIQSDASWDPLRGPPTGRAAGRVQAIMDKLEEGMRSGALQSEEALALVNQARHAARQRSLDQLLDSDRMVWSDPLRGEALYPARRRHPLEAEPSAHPAAHSAAPKQPAKSGAATNGAPRALSTRIRSTATLCDDYGRYTGYEVSVTDGTMSWVVWRRFRQFEVLHRFILEQRGFAPDLPPKYRFPLRGGVVAQRRVQLERFLSEVTSNLVALSPEQRRVVLNFLQAPADILSGAAAMESAPKEPSA